jgi:rhamnosyl/mannosyltransferase
MVSEIRKSHADLVHVHLPNPTAILALFASRYSGPLVVTYHSDTVRQKLLGRLFEPLLHAALRRSSAIIVTSPNYLETSSVLSSHKHKCKVIPYGVRTADFEEVDQPTVAKLRQEYGDRTIISVGRLVYYKGFEYLIRAMTKVRGRLLIVGEGPLRESLEQLACALGVAGRVTFVGEKQNADVIRYYHAADVFALASIARSEAFGIVQLEAMACGKPVVNTSLLSGVPFVSQHGVTGLTVPPANPDALAIAINSLLDQPQRCRQYGDAARRRVQQEFGLELMAQRTHLLYDGVLRSPAVPARTPKKGGVRVPAYSEMDVA